MAKKIAIVALGANLGNREKTLKSALSSLQKKGVPALAISKFYETVPVGFLTQPKFLNAAAALAVPEEISPEKLLQILFEIEKEFGRSRSFQNAPRTCDLDLIFFENEARNSPNLKLPHPRFRERAFVLIPLLDLFSAEISSSWREKKYWKEINAEIREILKKIDFSGVEIWNEKEAKIP